MARASDVENASELNVLDSSDVRRTSVVSGVSGRRNPIGSMVRYPNVRPSSGNDPRGALGSGKLVVADESSTNAKKRPPGEGTAVDVLTRFGEEDVIRANSKC